MLVHLKPFFSVAWPLFLGKLTVVPSGRSLGVVPTLTAHRWFSQPLWWCSPAIVVVVRAVVVVGSYLFWATSQGLVDDLGGLDKAIEVSGGGSAFSVLFVRQ